MADLFALRHQSYQAALEYYHAQGQYYTVRFSSDRIERITALKLVRETGHKYKAALEMQLAFFEAEGEYEPEKERTRRLIRVVQRELELLPG